jgi:hypothetical protein
VIASVSDPDCPYWHGEPRRVVDGPDGELMPVVRGVRTPLPAHVLALIEAEDDE